MVKDEQAKDVQRVTFSDRLGVVIIWAGLGMIVIWILNYAGF